MRSTSTARIAVRCAISSSATRRTGSTSFTSTACGWTPPRTSTTIPPEHILAADYREPFAKQRGGRQDDRGGENEPQEARLVRAQDRGGFGMDGLWNDDYHHTAVGRAHGPQRSVLHGLPRHSAGVHLRDEVRVSVSGAVLQVAEAAARIAFARPSEERVCHVYRKS